MTLKIIMKVFTLIKITSVVKSIQNSTTGNRTNMVNSLKPEPVQISNSIEAELEVNKHPHFHPNTELVNPNRLMSH